MPTLQEIVRDLDFITDRLSTQVRTVALGLAALSWALLLGESEAAAAAAEKMRSGLLLVGGLAVLTLLLDFLQYVFAYLDAKHAVEEAEKSDKEEADYDGSRLTYKLRFFFFGAKQVLAVGACVIFLVVIFRYLGS